CLTRKDLRSALKYLHNSIKKCPVEKETELSDMFYHLGVVFGKLGSIIPAIKSLDASVCASKTGPAVSVLNRMFPGDRLANDKSSFFILQLAYYLKNKKSGKIKSPAEGDMIIDLISMYLEEIVDSAILKGKCQSEKILIFNSISIDFPFSKAVTGVYDSTEMGQIIPFPGLNKHD
ncbi:MAG: hypothetical protein L3J12_03255, partial [Spirochaetales bacterium]|nr:hypothetical protein [Spirochaetales bacterium]